MFKRLMDRFDRALGRGVIDEALYEELEEGLLEADTHIETATDILDELRKAVREEKITSPEAMKERLKTSIAERLRQPGARGLIVSDEPPSVFVFVGVNGVGKTTTIAKVAHLLKRRGYSVLVAAGDTFRAAAIEQLETWAQRIGVEIVRNRPGSDSASVIFDAINAGKARKVDFILCDTAGRQHSKENLMTELGKVIRVAEKALGRHPDEVLLVLDANTGQNAVRQTEEFAKAVGITGLVVTKLDGTARGGAILGIYDKYKVPIKLIGVGEKVEDLKDFKPDQFAAQMFD
jgi:fused signal recognition particle receptor